MELLQTRGGPRGRNSTTSCPALESKAIRDTQGHQQARTTVEITAPLAAEPGRLRSAPNGRAPRLRKCTWKHLGSGATMSAIAPRVHKKYTRGPARAYVGHRKADTNQQVETNRCGGYEPVHLARRRPVVPLFL